MEIVKSYRDNPELRSSFNQLAGKTFGLDFEDWYRNGYWTDHYNPYSVVEDGKVIANVSVNIMDMMWDGEVKHLIQLGTVMTDEAYRNRGLIRRIMNEIDKDYEKKADGMYLFAGADVVEFYPKFGYHLENEYRYSKNVSVESKATMKKVPMTDHSQWDVLEKAIRSSRFHGEFLMTENIQLYMFYVSKFMQENIYYDERLDTYVIAEPENGELLIEAVFSKNDVALDDVITAFGSEIKKAVLGFTPKDADGYDCTRIYTEDTNLFVKGPAFDNFDEKRLVFQGLSHA